MIRKIIQKDTLKMNANTIFNAEMSLEEKLEAIDLAMAEAQEQFNVKNGRDNKDTGSLIDPALLTICDGCE